MEESISLLSLIKREFDCKEVDVRGYSPLTLAYIGDAAYELIVRTVVVERANRPAHELHKMAVAYVKAETQAAMIESVQDILTEEEEAVYKRGRNAKSYTASKNASVMDYRKATGFEALIGYLYLTDSIERAIEIVKAAIEKIGKKL